MYPGFVLCEENNLSFLKTTVSYFKYDGTAATIAGLMILMAFFIVFNYYLKVYMPLIKDTKRVSIELPIDTKSSLASTDFATNFEKINEVIENTVFYHSWTEFKETLNKDQRKENEIIYQNTKRPGEYFIPELILGQNRSFSSLDTWPGIFIGFGLLFTFLGLIGALFAAADAIRDSSDPNSVTAELQNLLQFASLKFITSVAGIICSIFITLSVKKMQNNMHGDLDRLNGKLESCLEYLSAEKLQIQTIKSIETMTGSVAKGVSDGVKKIAGNELRDFSTNMGQITTALSKTKPELEGVGKVYATELRTMETAVQESLKGVTSNLKSWTDDFGVALEENIKATSNVFTEYNDRMAKLIEDRAKQSETFNETISGSINSAISALQEASQQFSGSQNEAANNLRHATGELSAEMNRFLKDFTPLIDQLSKENAGLVEPLREFDNKIEQVKQAFSSYSVELKKVHGSLLEDSQNLRKTDDLHVTQLRNSIGSFQEAVSNLSKRFESLETNIQKAFDPLSDKVVQLSEDLKRGPTARSRLTSFFRRNRDE